MKVTLHASCHAMRDQGVLDQPRALLRQLRNVELVPWRGSRSAAASAAPSRCASPELSAAMACDKAADARGHRGRTGAVHRRRLPHEHRRHPGEAGRGPGRPAHRPVPLGAHPWPAEPGIDFLAASARALADPQLRRNFRRAMDGLMAKRAGAVPGSRRMDPACAPWAPPSGPRTC